MNIFFLDDDPYLAATYYGDKHVGKMLIECCQMMSQALRNNDLLKLSHIGTVYAPTHERHPMTLWVSQAQATYRWTYEHAIALAQEWVHRYGKPHGSASMLTTLGVGLTAMPKGTGWRNPPRCIPDEYKADYEFHEKQRRQRPWAFGMDQPCHVVSYRDYYANDKRHLHTWTNRDKPRWLVDYIKPMVTA